MIRPEDPVGIISQALLILRPDTTVAADNIDTLAHCAAARAHLRRVAGEKDAEQFLKERGL